MTSRFLLTTLVGVALMAGSAVQAYADKIVTVHYEVKSKNVAGFSASWLHTAVDGTSTTAGGHTWYTGGEKSHSLSGTIKADVNLTTGKVTFTGGSIIATDYTGSATIFGASDTDTSIDVTGGTLATSGSNPVRPSGFIEGTFDPGGTNQLDVDFKFIAHEFTSGLAGANSIADDFLRITLWGNNWDTTANTAAGGTGRGGLDLYLEGTIVPEPTTLALFGFGLFGGAVLRKRRRKALIVAQE